MRKPSVILRLLLLGALCALPCHAQKPDATPDNDDTPATRAPAAATGRWITDKTSHCRAWNPNPQPEESIRWIGECVDGLASGQGTVQWFEHGLLSEIAEGNFLKGKQEGKGTLRFANGFRYDGEFRENQFHGKGIMQFANGNRYEGEFADDGQNGKGVFLWKDGRRYEGDWVHGHRTGHGVMQWPDGRHYEGDFLKSQRTGKGVWTSRDGDRYEGEFLNGKFHGKGTMQWANGNHYEGDWQAGTRSGHGVWTGAGGERYEGRFEGGKFAPETAYEGAEDGLAKFEKSAGDTIQTAVEANAFDYAHMTDDGSTRALNDLHGYEISPYVERVKKLVYANWHHLINSSGVSYRHRTGQTVVQFAITSEGQVTKVKVVKSSHQGDLDGLFVQAISLSSPLPPLPKDLDRKELFLRLSAAYNPAGIPK